jgi:hypothetical protein
VFNQHQTSTPNLNTKPQHQTSTPNSFHFTPSIGIMDTFFFRSEAVKAAAAAKEALETFHKLDGELNDIINKVPMRLDPVIAADYAVPESQELGDVGESIARDTTAAFDLVARYANAKKEREETLRRSEQILESVKSWDSAIKEELAAGAEVPNDLDLLPDASNMIVKTALDIISKPGFKINNDLKQRMADCVASYCRANPDLAPASATQRPGASREASTGPERLSRVEHNEVFDLQTKLARSVSTRDDNAEKALARAQTVQDLTAEKLGLERRIKEASQKLSLSEAVIQQLRDENTGHEKTILDLHEKIDQQPTTEAVMRIQELWDEQEDEIAKLKAELESAGNEAKEHHSTASKLALANTKVTQLERQLEALESKSNELSAASDALAEDNGKLNDLIQQRDGALDQKNDEILSLQHELDKLQLELRKNEGEIGYYILEGKKAMQSISNAETSLKRESNGRAKAEEDLAAAKEALAQAQSAHAKDFGALQTRLEIAEEASRQARSARDQATTTFQQSLKDKESQLAQAKAAHSRELDSELARAKAGHCRELDRLQEDLTGARDELKKARSDAEVNGMHLRDKLADKNTMIQELTQAAQTEAAHASTRIKGLESDISELRAELKQAKLDSTAVAHRRDALQVELSAERAGNATLRHDSEAERDSSQYLVWRLCESISQIPLSLEDYAVFFGSLQGCIPIDAQSSQPHIGSSWKICLPWLAGGEDAEDPDNFVLLAFRRPLPILLSLFAAAKTGKTASNFGIHLLRALASHLAATANAQIELVFLVLGAVVDDCLQSPARCVFTCTVGLVIWQIANTIEAQWPSADVTRLRLVVRSQPLLHKLALAVDAAAVEELLGKKGLVSGNIGMLVCRGGSLLVADTTKRTMWCAAGWHIRFDPWRVEVPSLDTSAPLIMYIDVEDSRQVAWVADLKLKSAGWRGAE